MSLSGITLALAMTVAASFDPQVEDLLPNITDEHALIAALQNVQTSHANPVRTNSTVIRNEQPAPPPITEQAMTKSALKSKDNGIGSAVSLATMTILAAASIFGLAFFIRKYRTGSANLLSSRTRGELQLLDSLWVSRGLRLMVVRAGDQRLVLGSSSQGLSTLAVLDEKPSTAPQNNPTEQKTTPIAPKAEKTFENMLKQETRSANPLSSRKLQDVLHRLNSL